MEKTVESSTYWETPAEGLDKETVIQEDNISETEQTTESTFEVTITSAEETELVDWVA